MTNGNVQWVRDQVTLQEDVLALLRREGGLPKTRVIVALESCKESIDRALATLLQEEKVERYRAMSVRRRLDEHWCVKGAAPADRVNYRGAEILAALQTAAQRAGGVSA